MSPCCWGRKIKKTSAAGTESTVRSLLEERERKWKGYALVTEKPNGGILQCMYFFKSHTFYFKPVPLYLPRERRETSHSASRGFSPGNPHVAFARAADGAQRCLSGDLYKHITMFDSNPQPQKFPEKLPRSARFLIFPTGCPAFQRPANYIDAQIQTHQNRRCPEAPAAGKWLSALHNPGREAQKAPLCGSPWLTEMQAASLGPVGATNWGAGPRASKGQKLARG